MWIRRIIDSSKFVEIFMERNVKLMETFELRESKYFSPCFFRNPVAFRHIRQLIIYCYASCQHESEVIAGYDMLKL